MLKKNILKLSMMLSVFLLFYSCNKNTESSEWINPIIINGINIYPMSSLVDEMRFNGAWTAPKLNKNKQTYREVKAPGGEIYFNVVKKERYIVRIQLTKVMDISIQINKRTFKKKGIKMQISLYPKDINIGKNTLKFIIKDNQKLPVKRIEIYPKRTGKPSGKIFFFTPCKIIYYINPNCNKKISFGIDWENNRKIEAIVNITSELNKKTRNLHLSKRKTYFFSPIDTSINKICISILDKGRNKIKLKESIIYTKKHVTNEIPRIKKSFRNKNILIILLDAARADRFGSYGYYRNTTPNIDKLAKDSFVFTDFYSQAAFTLASTGTLLTGLSPDQHGVLNPFLNSLSEQIITIPESLKANGFFTAAISANPFFGKSTRYNQGFDNFIELFENSKQIMAEDFIKPFKKIIKEMNEKFFIYLHIREPHTSYIMPPPFLGKFQNIYKHQTKSLITLERKVHFSKKYSKEEARLVSDLYDENLSYADNIVGQILAILEKNKLKKNTIVIIMSDHGEGLNEHGLIGHNKILYKEGLHIPLIINIPGLNINKKQYIKPAFTSDLVYTLYDFLNIKYPYKKISRGKNLFSLPTFRNRISRSVPFISKYSAFMIESQPYRMIYFPSDKGKIFKLFNIVNDPLENKNITTKVLPKELLLFKLRNYIINANNGIHKSGKVKLREKDIKNLKSLGYIK